MLFFFLSRKLTTIKGKDSQCPKKKTQEDLGGSRESLCIPFPKFPNLHMGLATPRPSPLLPPSGCVLSRTLPDHLPAPACLPPYPSAAPGSRCPRRWARAAQAGSSDTHTHDAQNRQRHLAAPPTRRSWTPEAHPVPALRGPPAPPVRPSSFICPATQQLRSAFQRRLRTPKYPLNSSRAPCSRGGGAELKPHVGAFGGPPPRLRQELGGLRALVSAQVSASG